MDNESPDLIYLANLVGSLTNLTTNQQSTEFWQVFSEAKAMILVYIFKITSLTQSTVRAIQNKNAVHIEKRTFRLSAFVKLVFFNGQPLF